MYCRKCGTKNDDNAYRCVQCGEVVQTAVPAQAPAGAQSAQVKIPTYLAQAIISMLCCCQIPGIVAIVFAAQVNSKLVAGDIEGAVKASRNAQIWCWVALGAGALFWVFYLLMVLLGATGSAFTHHY
jgi:uncharacterized membrane protein YvbJ